MAGRAAIFDNIVYPSANWIKTDNMTSVTAGFGETALWTHRNITHEEPVPCPNVSSRKYSLSALASGCFSFMRTNPMPAVVTPNPPSGHRQTRGLSYTTNPTDPRHERDRSFSFSAGASLDLVPTNGL